MRSGNAVSSHNGLTPSETLYEKRGRLIWPIARRGNLISPSSAAFATIFVTVPHLSKCILKDFRNVYLHIDSLNWRHSHPHLFTLALVFHSTTT